MVWRGVYMSMKKVLDAFDSPLSGELNGPVTFLARLSEGLHLVLGTKVALSALKEYIKLNS